MPSFNGYTENYKIFARSYKNGLDALYAYALSLYNQGKIQESVPYFKEAILEAQRTHQLLQQHHYAMLALASYTLGDFSSAYEAGKQALQLTPNDCGMMSNLGHYAALVGKYEEAIAYHKRCLELDPTFYNPLDSLARIYLNIKNLKEAHHYGLLALEKKDSDVFDEKNIAWLLKASQRKNLDYQKTMKIFNSEQSHRNIISFSLWGNNPRYTENAIQNAILAKVIYPGWRCRFYCDDSVESRVKKKLIDNDAEVIAAKFKGAFYGLFWRFFVMSDPNVDFFLVRDCDSVINCQERIAVDEWLSSQTCFHTMHDHYGHTELIHAGMFGGIANLLPNMHALIDQFYNKTPKVRTMDQLFLRYCVWPFVKQSYLDHNSFYTFGNSKPFPKLGHFPSDKWHVGQNMGINPKTSLLNNSVTLWDKLSFL